MFKYASMPAVNPFAPPEQEPDAAGAQGGLRPRWRDPVLLGIGGFIGLWGFTVAEIQHAAPGAPSSGAFTAIGVLAFLAFGAHVLGLASALLDRRGRWIVGALINLGALAILVFLLILALRKA